VPVINIPAHTKPACELAEQLAKQFGALSARRACIREIFIAELQNNDNDLAYWLEVSATLAAREPSVALFRELPDSTITRDGFVLNRIFVKIKDPEARAAVIREAIIALRGVSV